MNLDDDQIRDGGEATHALRRTSPKGGPFFGTCILCGALNLPSSAALKPCSNPQGVSNDQALIACIEGDDR